MTFASVTFKECGWRPSAVQDDFENPSLPSCCEPYVRVDVNQREQAIISVAPRTQSDKRTLVAGRSADPDRDYGNVGHRLRIWMHDGEKAR